MAAPRFFMVMLLVLTIAVAATWGACEYICNDTDADTEFDSYKSCVLKKTGDDACPSCADFCIFTGRADELLEVPMK